MKYNFNNYILNSETFLDYLFDNTHIPHTHYEKFIQDNEKKWNIQYSRLIEICDQHNINIYPYLYTIERIDKNQFEAFCKFFLTMISSTPESNAIEVASSSLENAICFIITIQYVFL